MELVNKQTDKMTILKEKIMEKKLLDNFNKFINEQDVEAYEVCLFIHSLLTEHGYEYRPTGCYGNEYVLKDM